MSATYPLDRLGVLSSNQVKNEVHTLHPVTAGQFNFIVPRAAPLFGTGVVVEYFTGDIPTTEQELEQIQMTRLQHGVDYLLTHRVDVPNELTDSALYASITFIDITLKGHVVIRYRTVGSTMVVNEMQIAKTLAAKTTDPRTVYWNDIIQDIEFPPSAHFDNAETLYGMEALIQQLRDIEVAIAGGTNNEHFHEITSINGLADKLHEAVSNRGPHKLNVGPHHHFVLQNGPFEIVLPDFDSDVHVNVKLGIVGSEGRSIISLHADIPKVTAPNTVVPDSVAYFEDDYLSDQAEGHLVYRHVDGRLRMALDIGRLENVMVFIASVSMNSPNTRVYIDGWGINDTPERVPAAISQDLNVLTGGGLRLDFAKTGEVKPNSCWMVMSKDGALNRTLPSKAPDNSVVLVRDHGDNATNNNALITGDIAYGQGQNTDGLVLDNSRGWFKLQYRKVDNKWHVVSGA